MLRAPESVDLKNDDDQFTYRVGLNWTPSNDLLVFGSYSTGYKSGGFNSGGGNVALGQKRSSTRKPRQLRGWRQVDAGDGAHMNGTLFRMDLSDFQDRAFDGASFNVINAGDLRNQGVELDGDFAIVDNCVCWRARLPGLRVYRLPSSFVPAPSCAGQPSCTQDLEGERNIYSPKWQGSVGAQIEGDLEFGDVGFLFRTDVSYADDANVNTINDNNLTLLDPVPATTCRSTSAETGCPQCVNTWSRAQP